MPIHDHEERLQTGCEHFRKGRLAEAEALFEDLLSSDPGDPNAANLLGLVRKKQGRLAEAERLFRHAIAGMRDAGGFHNNLGGVLRMQGRPDEALASYRTALMVEPGNPDACLNLARLLQPLGEYLQALSILEAGLESAPKDGELWAEKGKILSCCGDGEGALSCHRRSLGLDPGSPTAWASLGDSLLFLGEAAAAVKSMERSLELDPNQDSTGAVLLMAHQYAGEISPADLAKLHREWTRRAFPSGPPPKWKVNRDPGRPIRVGVLSPDLRAHSVGSFLMPLLRQHDPSSLKLVAYSTSTLATESSDEKFRPYFTLWRDAAWLGTDELVNRIREDQVDILLELAGHTEGSRLDVIARHASPIQVFWLGYPGTTGLKAFQGRFTDMWVDPPGEEALSAEAPLRLPHGFHCYSPDPEAPEVSQLPALATGSLTFASFNNLAKLNSGVLRVWASLLRRLPGTRLVLKSNRNEDPYPLNRIRDLFREEGVAPSRVDLLGRIEGKGAHLAQYRQVDIALDPFPYNGVTTTCEALWMGVPVITLLGDRHAGRYGASLLHQAGLEDFVAANLDEYLAIALSWARDLPRLGELRRSMRDRLQASALLDSRGFAQDVERVLRGLWREWCVAPNG